MGFGGQQPPQYAPAAYPPPAGQGFNQAYPPPGQPVTVQPGSAGAAGG